ncbi:MAG: D-alanyl-D-alanine carboxypeptidase/D-alanyl-D-alanine-endopeptidase [Desulfobacterales bacterium]|jgi:D-alanyl-D-alanine carboxypeptidase/D-alanyl-D-alanine-endopeptidase (penicillin-binding protein 4)|nr:D-alanyl-D-alanine carboxypeptidase/D-alanyl-D-alanine-endopeptidase [Desulfobacterales bacterium]
MKRTGYLILLSLAAGLAGCGGRAVLQPPAVVVAVDSAAVKRSLLAARIDSLLADTVLAQAAVGACIVEVDGGNRELYARNKASLFVPASVNKLFTTAAAFAHWGPYHRFQTLVRGDSVDARGRLDGDLYLQGRGAPDLRPSDLDRLAFVLRARGLRSVAGRVVADAGYFDTTAFGAGWMWDEGPYAYNAPVSALSLGGNAFDLGFAPASRPGLPVGVQLDPPSGYFALDNKGVTGRPEGRRTLQADRAFDGARDRVTVRGSLPADAAPLFVSRSVSSPVQYCATAFREALRRRGIEVRGGTAAGAAPEYLPVLASLNSRPLHAIVRDMDKESDNFTAEMLFRGLDRDSAGADSGMHRVARYLFGIGFAPGSFTIADGSGLSRYNLCTPEQVAATLLSLYRDPLLRPELLVALPVAGVDGTLWRRFPNGDGRARVRAKTGTMTGVSCLAGFAWGPGEKVYCFALMFNNYTAKADAVRRIQDDILRVLLEIAP